MLWLRAHHLSVRIGIPVQASAHVVRAPLGSRHLQDLETQRESCRTNPDLTPFCRQMIAGFKSLRLTKVYRACTFGCYQSVIDSQILLSYSYNSTYMWDRFESGGPFSKSALFCARRKCGVPISGHQALWGSGLVASPHCCGQPRLFSEAGPT